MLTVSSASGDIGSAAWSELGATWADPREMESYGGPQVARVFVRFSDAAATATIAVALVDETGEVWEYTEGFAAAGARRSSEDGASGDYMGMGPDFRSGAAPTAYVAGVQTVDLAHPPTTGSGNSVAAGAVSSNSRGLFWKIGVTALSAGSVDVSWALMRQM